MHTRNFFVAWKRDGEHGQITEINVDTHAGLPGTPDTQDPGDWDVATFMQQVFDIEGLGVYEATDIGHDIVGIFEVQGNLQYLH